MVMTPEPKRRTTYTSDLALSQLLVLSVKVATCTAPGVQEDLFQIKIIASVHKELEGEAT